VRSHRRKSLAAGLFIIVGTAMLVFMHAMTMGITDTMVLNTTALHTGHAFAEFSSSEMDPVTLADKTMKKPAVRIALPRYRFAGIIMHDKGASPAQVFAVRTPD
jgi:ABC-type lipoprotein release transport system permease subunit